MHSTEQAAAAPEPSSLSPACTARGAAAELRVGWPGIVCLMLCAHGISSLLNSPLDPLREVDDVSCSHLEMVAFQGHRL